MKRRNPAEVPVVTDQQLATEIEPVVRAAGARPLLKVFVLQFATTVMVLGAGTMWVTEQTLASFRPSLAWILVVCLGAAFVAAGPVMIRTWGARRYLTRTSAELREEEARYWSTLKRPGWVGRMLGFSLVGTVVAGASMGALFAVLFPEDRFFGTALGTIGVMTLLFLVPVVAMVFGGRALMVRQRERQMASRLRAEEG